MIENYKERKERAGLRVFDTNPTASQIVADINNAVRGIIEADPQLLDIAQDIARMGLPFDSVRKLVEAAKRTTAPVENLRNLAAQIATVREKPLAIARITAEINRRTEPVEILKSTGPNRAQRRAAKFGKGRR